ncbi:hypothetical protein SODALDRAFT_355521 [Sodiomyces alkalinus F11]|uniref:BTB domain-containing protein n=1 Tax=Sodiomyces alkalinus (strain CBS 110278 / VKM F-3762 / F11) TaxID=1314773 RepID=A0A3N2Q967_SODAK|nr:hypothetical protein SODALDRAFT_355521 [Sodiomyces alkalinus F11]ROT43313.1 hypothetical protein SODALDRAFT_355521 [Sodiomyces alkalinus F11]
MSVLESKQGAQSGVGFVGHLALNAHTAAAIASLPVTSYPRIPAIASHHHPLLPPPSELLLHIYDAGIIASLIYCIPTDRNQAPAGPVIAIAIAIFISIPNSLEVQSLAHEGQATRGHPCPMSHLLWKYYWDNDVDKFRRLLAPATQTASQPPLKSSAVPAGSWNHSSGFPAAPNSSPRTANKSRKASSGTVLGAFTGKGSGSHGLGKAEVNSRDYAGLTILLRAAASTRPESLLFVQALLDHPAIDLYARDTESGWNALHRALYSGNITIARLLLEKERRLLTEQTSSTAVARVGQLIKTKDHEGSSPFDLYNSTIATRSLKHLGDTMDRCSESGGDSDTDDDEDLVAGPVSSFREATVGEEIFMFGSNKNLSLGVGDEDDRQFPERILLRRPDRLLRRFYDEYLERARNDPTSGVSQSDLEVEDLNMIPALTRHRPLLFQDAVLSKFHSAILTADPVSNLYICGIGLSGRLGLGDLNTQFRFLPVQGGLADKKVIQVALGQSHTMALTDTGELWTWGSNSNAQLGYALPPARKDEEPMSTTPRQVFGPLKKEIINGVAASSVHSVAHTSHSLFCWGKNLGQLGLMDADSRSLEVQPTPRRVAVSLFSSNIIAVSAIDKATTCLLEDSSVCVFTSYGFNFLKFPVPDAFANHRFASRFVSSKQDTTSRNRVAYITSGGETIAAVTGQGDLFTVNLNHRAEAAPAATSTTNPAKIKGALTTPQCIWQARKDGVKSVSVGEHGSVIICTESGAVWRRVKRTKAKDTRLSESADTRRGDFKFQRVPSVTKAVAVRSSTFGAFAAIRKDCDVTRTQIGVQSKSLRDDLSPLLVLRGFQASDPGRDGTHTLRFWDADALRDTLGDLPYELLRSPGLDVDLARHLRFVSSSTFDFDVLLSTSSSPDVRIPAHGWILAARSSILRGMFTEYRRTGRYEMPETLVIREHEGKTLVQFQSIDLLSLVNVIVYCYDDTVVPVWNFTRQAPPLAYRYRQIRVELMKVASKLQLTKLEAAARMQTRVERSLDRDMKAAIRDPRFFQDADALIALDGEEVPVHSQLLRLRCAFFEGLFHGRSGGMWLAGRREMLAEEEQVTVDMTHLDPDAFRYVLRYLYADVGTELFDDTVSSDVDDFSDTVMQVMSIANELMLDRLSQVCQRILGRFVTTRNVAGLLNEISPCSVTEFKDAGLEYVCLQVETMLENHYLDGLDEELMEELDAVVRQNQGAQCPFARSRLTEALMFERYPELASDIEEEHQVRVKEMAYRASQRDDDRRFLSSSFRTKFGSLDDATTVSPVQEKGRRKAKVAQTDSVSPLLRAKGSHGDLMFDMDDEEGFPAASPTCSPPQRAVNGKGSVDVSRIPLLSGQEPTGGSVPSPASSLPLRSVLAHRTPPGSPSQVSQGKGPASGGSPWGAAALPTSRMDLRELLAATPIKSALSAGIEAQTAREASVRPAPPQPKMSQKERKKQKQQQQEQQQQQQQQAHAAAAHAAETQRPKVAWDPETSKSKAAPWKVVSGVPKAPLRDVMAAESSRPAAAAASASASELTTAASIRKPLVAAESPAQSIRRTASPDTRFPGQSRGSNSTTSPAAASASASASVATPPSSSKPITPHSRTYIAPARKAEPILGLSMSDIIGQQRREQEAVRAAAAKRSMQEIQQEQEFQEWWDQESRRVQEEEARRAAKEKERDDRGKGGQRGGGGRRGRRERGGRKGADDSADREVGAVAEGSGSGQGARPQKNSRGRGGRRGGGRASTTAA